MQEVLNFWDVNVAALQTSSSGLRDLIADLMEDCKSFNGEQSKV